MLGLVLRDYCVPAAGSQTFARVFTAAVRRVIGELLAVSPSAARGEERKRELSQLAVEIAAAAKREPGALAAFARQPTVWALLRCLRAAAPDTRDALAGELVATLALELAFAGLLREPLRVSSPPAEIVALGARRRVRLAAGAAEVVIQPAGTVAGALEVDEPFHFVSGGMVLALADNNPMRMFEAHPDKQGNTIDLGGKPVEDWTASLSAALDLIGEHLPAFRAEVDLVLRQIVPVGFFPESHLSASYQEAIGTIYLSLHPSPLTMAEAIVHEVSHNKLNVLFEQDAVIENDPNETYTSPVRPDPRPIHGVLLAVHAFLPVERMYRNMLAAGAAPGEPELRRHVERVSELNRQGAEVLLRHGKPSLMGRAILDEIELLTRGAG
jgi:HEXXH motif-containing protein